MEIRAEASFNHILEMEHDDSLKAKIQLRLSSLRKKHRKNQEILFIWAYHQHKQD